jgi:hypothetical protein
VSLKDDLWAYLNGTPGVTSVFSNASPDQIRVYPQVLPQDPTYPAATYQLVGRQRQPLMGNDTGNVVRSSVNVDVYGQTSESVETGSAAIRAALIDFRGLMVATQVERLLLENEIDLTDVEPGLFRNSMSFTIWHEE